MSFLAGRLASTEGAYFIQESKQAVSKLAQKISSSSSSKEALGHGESLDKPKADVLHEVLRHSLPPTLFSPSPDSSLTKTSKWVLSHSSNSTSSLRADAINPLRGFLTLPQVTFGPRRWELPEANHLVLASTANDLRHDRHLLIGPEQLKEATEGLLAVGKAFAIATVLVVGGASLTFGHVASKYELHNADDIKAKGKTLLQPQVEMLKARLTPFRVWAENVSRNWHVHWVKDEKPPIVQQLSKVLGGRTDS